ncbi:MAG TPA: family 78 glycoside hydrolase catalytic domain, partial [Armatimonadota bacterium]|nr:family 78 glycoside hydrolase catalytic domain [Armatimonadota bacterium]
EPHGWDRAGFDDSGWKAAVPAPEPVGPLTAQSVPPIRIGETLRTVKVTEPKPGVFLFDLGRNFGGWAGLRARGPAGTRITLRYGELLYPDGTLNPMTSVAGQIKGRKANLQVGAPETAWQTDTFILKGEGEEEYRPRFTFHGFRYVEVTGYPGRPGPEAVTGYALHSDVPSAGEFSCSSDLFNRVQQITRWTLLSNIFSVESDCPHREKLGYGGDIVAASEMALFNFDMAQFYAKAVRDLADAVRPNGGFTETAPYVGIADQTLGEGSGPVGWGTAHPLLVHQLYQYYGDRRLTAEQYENARRWVELLRSRAQDGILDNGISDHESLVPKPVALTGTAFYYLNTKLLAEMATRLEKRADAERYAALATSIREAFNRRFLKPGTGRYDTGTQACQAFALFMGL